MSETQTVDVVDVKTGEVVDEKVALVKRNAMESLVKQQDMPLLAVMEQLDTLDWKSLKPHHAALLLMQRPFAVSGGGFTNLTFKQAILFATRCYELGLSPFSDNVWFDPSRGVTNVTLSGKRELARIRGIDLGPPSFEELNREWDAVAKITTSGEEAKKAGFKKDLGVTCSMRVGDPRNNEKVSYTAWINDWFQPRSPVWREKPNHMLAIRANEKALSLVLGTGASAMPDERELD